MLRPNGQRQCNFTPNLKNKPMDIEIDLEDFPDISQQKKMSLKVKDDTVIQPGHDDPLIG